MNPLYETYKKEQFLRFEGVCKRCGECCGSQDGDPCMNLGKDAHDKYYCIVYDDRLGPQRTKSGKIFNCVLIRNLKAQGYLRLNCAYVTDRG